MNDAHEIIVVKVGGSLFDLPDLGQRLQAWLSRQGAARVFLVPGGGPTADCVRDWDRRHHLGETRAHWLALRALTLNAHFLAGVLPQSQVIQHLSRPDMPHLEAAQGCRLVPIVDMYDFAFDDEQHDGHLPHSWDTTSDSLSARVAERLSAQRLVLLKSVTIDPGIDWKKAAGRGLVDAFFAEIVQRARLRVEIVNLRNES